MRRTSSASIKRQRIYAAIERESAQAKEAIMRKAQDILRPPDTRDPIEMARIANKALKDLA